MLGTNNIEALHLLKKYSNTKKASLSEAFFLLLYRILLHFMFIGTQITQV